MGIGHHVQKYQAAKEARAAQEQEAETAMDIADPKGYAITQTYGPAQTYAHTPAPPAPSFSMADVMAMIKALAQELRSDGPNETAVQQVALIEKLITKTHPENVDHPGISVYSYPEGDVARPKPDLKCKMFWIGYEMRPETLAPGEIELLNRLTAGEYRVTKADGTGIPFRVQAKASDKLDAAGRPTVEELSIWFPCKGDQRDNHLSMTSYLQQVLGDKLPTVTEMMAELARLKAELARERVGAGAV